MPPCLTKISLVSRNKSKYFPPVLQTNPQSDQRPLPPPPPDQTRTQRVQFQYKNSPNCMILCIIGPEIYSGKRSSFNAPSKTWFHKGILVTSPDHFWPGVRGIFFPPRSFTGARTTNMGMHGPPQSNTPTDGGNQRRRRSLFVVVKVRCDEVSVRRSKGQL